MRERPSASAGKEPWSLPAIGMASVVMAFLEPDPHAEWDDGRLSETHRVLDAWAAPGGP